VVVEEEVQQWPPSREQAGTNCLVAEPALRVVAVLVVEVLVVNP